MSFGSSRILSAQSCNCTRFFQIYFLRLQTSLYTQVLFLWLVHLSESCASSLCQHLVKNSCVRRVNKLKQAINEKLHNSEKRNWLTVTTIGTSNYFLLGNPRKNIESFHKCDKHVYARFSFVAIEKTHCVYCCHTIAYLVSLLLVRVCYYHASVIRRIWQR